MIATTPRTASLYRKLVKVRVALAQFAHRTIRHPGGGLVTIGSAFQELRQLRQVIRAEQDAESHRHEKVGRFQRFLTWFLPILDGFVFLWFMIGIMNVDLRQPGLLFGIAAVFATIATVVVAAWNAVLGQRLRIHKSESKGIIWDAVETLDKIMLGISAVMALLVGTMMFVRVHEEIYQATGANNAASIIIAVALAAAVVVLNLYVLLLVFQDGSTQTHRADQLTRKLRRPVRRHERDQATVVRLEAQLRLLQGGFAGEVPELPAA